MLASTATASARAGTLSTVALTGYLSSRLASSSALIAEISPNTASTCSPRRRYERTTCAAGAGGALVPAARRACRGCVGRDLGDQRRAAGQARTEVAGERHRAERPCPGRSGGGAGQHDDGGPGRR